MNFGNLEGLGGSIAGFISTSEGQTAVKNFLATPDGMSLLKDFAATPQGQQAIMSILPSVVDGLDLPEPVKAMIKSAAPAQQ